MSPRRDVSATKAKSSGLTILYVDSFTPFKSALVSMNSLFVDIPRTAFAPNSSAVLGSFSSFIYSPKNTFGESSICFKSSEFITKLLESMLKSFLIACLALQKISDHYSCIAHDPLIINILVPINKFDVATRDKGEIIVFNFC